MTCIVDKNNSASVQEKLENNFLQAISYITEDNNEKIIPINKIEDLSISLKEQRKKIVTINGTFDILHRGHEKILKEAKAQGDILIVGLNSDSSVKIA